MNVGIHKIPQHTTCLEAALLLAKSELIGGGEKCLGIGIWSTVDGYPSYDPLLGDNSDVMPREMDDETLRARIWRRYVATNGLFYKDSASVKQWLPHSDMLVFTHEDLIL
ncbi:hypothetical protein HC256_006020 [Beauveria bassiana]|nr:hypothetical protein HC256_006020 [Beauveria bassiana]